MDDSFEVLEKRVHRAAELVKRLRREKEGLAADLARAKAALVEADRQLATLEKDRKGSDARVEEVDLLRGQLGALRQEREEVRQRIAKLVELLESLD